MLPDDVPPGAGGPSAPASPGPGITSSRSVGMLRPLRLDAPTVGTMRARAVLSTVGIGVQGGLRFLSSVLVGRIGGDAVLGVVNSAISAAMFLTLLGPQSTGNAASKFVARARGAGRYDEAQRVAVHLARRTLFVSLLLAAVAVVSWSAISGEPLSRSWRGGLCVAALVVGYAGYSFVRGLQFGAGQVPRATAWDVASVVVGLTGLVVLLAAGVRSTALLLPLALAYGVYTAAGWPRAVRRTRPPSDPARPFSDAESPTGSGPRFSDDHSPNGPARPDDFASLDKRRDPTSPTSHIERHPSSPGSPESAAGVGSGPVSGSVDGANAAGTTLSRTLRQEIDHFVLFGLAGAVAVTGFLQLSMVVAKLVDSDAQAGQYAAALSLATPASLLAGSLSLVLFPAMAESWGRGDLDGFRRQGDHAMRLLVLIMVGVFGALVLVTRPLVRVVFGADFAHAATLLPWLLLAVLTISIGVGAVTSLTTRSQRGVVLSSAASAAGLIVGVVVWAVIAPDHGVRGVAIGYLVGTVVGTVVPIALVWRQDRQRWAGLALRGAFGLLVLLALLWVENRFGASPFGEASTIAAGEPSSSAYSSTLTLTFESDSQVSAWWLDPLCAIGFLIAWLAVSWPDARRLLPPLLRRR